jgi:hypothetical protein
MGNRRGCYHRRIQQAPPFGVIGGPAGKRRRKRAPHGALRNRGGVDRHMEGLSRKRGGMIADCGFGIAE